MNSISYKFNPKNKRSTKNLNEILEYISDDKDLLQSDKNEIIGDSSIKTIKDIVSEIKISNNELTPKVIDSINKVYINKKYTDKNYISKLHSKIVILNKKGFIRKYIEVDEIKNKIIGVSTKACIKDFQEKYKLKSTGIMDAATDEKLESVYTSITGKKTNPIKLFKVPENIKLKRIVNKIRINTISDQVYNLQKALTCLNYKLDKKESDKKRYGKTTKQAVEMFQKLHNIEITGQVNMSTAKAINKELAVEHKEILDDGKIRVRGSVRDESWVGMANVNVNVYQLKIGGELTILGETKTYPNGFYIIGFESPITKQDSSLHLVVEIKKGSQNLLYKEFLDINKSIWVNYTKGNVKYQGISEFEKITKYINKCLRNTNSSIKIIDLEESDKKHDIKFISKETKISIKEVMKYFLAHRLSNIIKDKNLTPAVFYGFMKQNAFNLNEEDLKPKETKLWHTWLQKVEKQLLKSILMMDKQEHESILKASFDNNLIPRSLMYK